MKKLKMNKNRIKKQKQKLKDYLYTTGTILCAKQKVIEGKLDEAQAFLKMQFDYYVKLYSKMSKKRFRYIIKN